jgi:hypothetical protein
MAKWGLDIRFIIGINGAQLSRMEENKVAGIYRNSRTTIYNNNTINK